MAIEGRRNGEIMSNWNKPPKADQSVNYASKAPGDGNCPSGGCKDGSWEPMRVEQYNDWYQKRSWGWEYVGSDYLGSYTEWIFVSTGSNYQRERHQHGSGGNYSNGSAPSPGTIKGNPHNGEKILNDKTFNIIKSQLTKANKPKFEYNDKCLGINKMWSMTESYNAEIIGFLTTNEKIIITDIGSYSNGSFSGIMEHEDGSPNKNQAYYAYPTSSGPPSTDHPGMVVRHDYYFIPIAAVIHTHNPCRKDGTDGVSQVASTGDQALANKYRNSTLRYWAIGCGAIGELKPGYSSFSRQRGSLSDLCSKVQ